MQTNLESTVTVQLKPLTRTLPEQHVTGDTEPEEVKEAMTTHMDYAEDLTLNAPLQPLDSEHDYDNKNKSRRYWSPSEEERFYEIWGRDNWRLTKHGKNTVFFAKWADELRDRFDLDIKPEEIQAKVNQTRAKFRQVKKTIQSGGGSAARWKKYAIIDSILKNQYRPKDAEPIPKEALERNRDVTPPPAKSITADASPAAIATSVISTQADQLSMDNSMSSEHNISSGYFNSSEPSRLSYSTELFTDNYDEIKQEYEDETFRTQQQQQHQQQYQHQPAQNETSYSPVEETTLHELQTPQQQQQQQQYRTQYDSSQPHHSNTVTDQTTSMSNAAEYNNNATSKSNTVTYLQQQQQQQATKNNAVTTNGIMQPPDAGVATVTTVAVATARSQSAPARKRGRPHGNAGPGSTVTAMDSLEVTYLEEVRRKNQLLEDQVQISRRRLELEERKVALMTQFFPKCLEQQAQIIARLQPN